MLAFFFEDPLCSLTLLAFQDRFEKGTFYISLGWSVAIAIEKFSQAACGFSNTL
jgi:hypothetical protein